MRIKGAMQRLPSLNDFNSAKPFLLSAFTFALTGVIFVAPVSAESFDKKRNKSQSRSPARQLPARGQPSVGAPPGASFDAIDPRVGHARPAVVRTPTSKERKSRTEITPGHASKPNRRPLPDGGETATRHVSKATKTPSPSLSRRDAQASTADDSNGGKRQIAPSAKQGPTVQQKATTSASASQTASADSSQSRKSGKPHYIDTKWGKIPIYDDSEAPADPNDIEEPDEHGSVSWITKGGTVVRARLTKATIDELNEIYGETEEKNRFEDLNKNGAAGINKNLDTRADLQHAFGFDRETAKEVADELSKKGGKAREDVLQDALIKNAIVPAGLKNTGRSSKDLIDLAAKLQQAHGTDVDQMTPEFVDDVEKAKRNGNVGEVLSKWKKKFDADAAAADRAARQRDGARPQLPPGTEDLGETVITAGALEGNGNVPAKIPEKAPDASRLQTLPNAVPKDGFDLPTTGTIGQTGGRATAPSFGNTTPTHAPRADVGAGSGATMGSAPAGWATHPSGNGSSSSGTSSGAGSSGASGPPSSGNSSSERQTTQAEDRLSRSEKSNGGSGSSNPGSGGGSAAPVATHAPAPSGDYTVEMQEDKVLVTDDDATEGEKGDAPTPKPDQGTAYVPPDYEGGGRGNRPGSWKKGLRPGQVEAIEKAAPQKGGEKENPGEQGGGSSGRRGSINDANKRKQQLLGNPGAPPEPQVNAPPPDSPQTGPSGGNTVSNPDPNAPDEVHAIPGDPDKTFGRDDGTSQKNASQSSSSTTPRVGSGRPVKGEGRKGASPTPTASASPHTSGQSYQAIQPNLPPPSPTSSP